MIQGKTGSKNNSYETFDMCAAQEIQIIVDKNGRTLQNDMIILLQIEKP